MKDNIEISLEVDVQKVNVILSALTQLPYGQVFSLIDSIKKQAEDQISNFVETI